MIFAPPAPLISFIDSGSNCHVYKFYESWIGADPFCNICISKPCLDILLFLDLIATFIYFMIYGSPVHPVHGFWISSPSLWLSIVSSIIIFPWILLSCLLFFFSESDNGVMTWTNITCPSWGNASIGCRFPSQRTRALFQYPVRRLIVKLTKSRSR